STPTVLAIPDNVRHIDRVWYNVSKEPGEVKYRELHYVCPEDFVVRFGTKGDTRQLVSYGDVSFYVSNDRMPSFYTSFNDKDIVCDSFDSDIETTLTSSRAKVYASVVPEFIVDDGHVPDLP